MARSRPRAPAGRSLLLSLSLVTSVAVLVGLLLQALHAPSAAPSLALLPGALALLSLAVGVNAHLRLQGVGGEGLVGATGVLGAALALIGQGFAIVARDASAWTDGFASGVTAAELLALQTAGWMLTAFWVLHAGRGLERLFAPRGWLVWGSVAAAVLTAAIALDTWLGARAAGAVGYEPSTLAFLPLGVWSAGVAATCALGRAVTAEPVQE